MDIEEVPNTTPANIDLADVDEALANAERQQEEMREFNQREKELLKEFYDNIYPYEAMIDWLSYNNKPLSKIENYDNTYFNRREVAYIVT